MHETLRAGLAGAAWYNTGGREFDVAALRGRAVAVLAFSFDPAGLTAWRALSDLAARLGPGFVCLGAHLPGKAGPLERESLRKSLRRFAIPWPVADGTAWPRTPGLTLFGPDGAEAWRGAPADIGAMASLAERWPGRGPSAAGPFVLSPEEELRHDDVLHFPEGVEALGRRVFLADTGADRVIGAYFADEEPVAQVEWVAGAGRGLADGPLDRARFDGPRGLAASPDGESLYVADSLNSAVRVIDLRRYEVRTLCAGLGPVWDVCLCGDALYAALPLAGEVRRVDLRDGASAPLLAASCPVALAASGTRLWVLRDDGELVWRDVASGAEGRLAPSPALSGGAGLAVLEDGAPCAADPAGNALWRIDPATGAARIVAGKGRGHVDGPRPRFFGPHGVARLSRTLLVADSCNHALRAVSAASGSAGSVTLFAAS